MRKLLSIILGVIALLSIAWAVSYPLDGIAWFPGFFIAVFCAICAIGIMDVGKPVKKNTRP